MRVYFASKSGRLAHFGGAAHGKPSKYLIFGDWLDVEDHPDDARLYVVNWRAWNAQRGRVIIEKHQIPRDACRHEAVLEMIFVDVGQGDGCIVTVPDGSSQHTLVIDAGQRSNMKNLLNWRFRYLTDDRALHTAVITHPDSDHYAGFQGIFDDPRISFRHVHINGLLDRTMPKGQEDERIGPRVGGNCTEIYETSQELATALSDQTIKGMYPKLLRTALGRAWPVTMCSTRHGEQVDGRTYLPGFAPGQTSASIEVLGPVPTTHGDRTSLKCFGDAPNDGGFDVGKTKNGHSILLKLRLGGFSVIFGGDLNRSSEDYLLRHYGEVGPDVPLRHAVPKAKDSLGADFLKCCHHGSADVTDEFLEAVEPFGFVVSSGDEESHVHPRPEVLGLLGKKGRGERPLVLCTEILRSTPPSKSLSEEDARKHEELMDAVGAATTKQAGSAARKALSDFWNRRFARLVGVYGAINVRTDGQRLFVGFRKEKPGNGSPWQLYEYALEEGEWREVREAGAH